MHYKAVCFGEVLWDNLPSGKKLGGAPLNVSYHLNRLGVPTAMLTRIGEDANGVEIEALCRNLGVPTVLFQKDEVHPTSTVEVEIGEDKEVHYEIVFPVAWDFIQSDAKASDIVTNADFFVFGSLSSRNGVSYDTLMEMLDVANYKVFDVNLRAPFHTKERVLELLSKTDLVKMNKVELQTIATWTDLDMDRDVDRVWALMDIYQLQEAVITYGAEGAVYYSKALDLVYHFPAYRVEINDTIGSGDSFLAAFLTKRFEAKEDLLIEDIMDFSAMISGFVTQSSGACPPYEQNDITRFQWLNPLYKAKY